MLEGVLWVAIRRNARPRGFSDLGGHKAKSVAELAVLSGSPSPWISWIRLRRCRMSL